MSLRFWCWLAQEGRPGDEERANGRWVSAPYIECHDEAAEEFAEARVYSGEFASSLIVGVAHAADGGPFKLFDVTVEAIPQAVAYERKEAPRG